jgi:hypothetical protein
MANWRRAFLIQGQSPLKFKIFRQLLWLYGILAVVGAVFLVALEYKISALPQLVSSELAARPAGQERDDLIARVIGEGVLLVCERDEDLLAAEVELYSLASDTMVKVYVLEEMLTVPFASECSRKLREFHRSEVVRLLSCGAPELVSRHLAGYALYSEDREGDRAVIARMAAGNMVSEAAGRRAARYLHRDGWRSYRGDREREDVARALAVQAVKDGAMSRMTVAQTMGLVAAAFSAASGDSAAGLSVRSDTDAVVVLDECGELFRLSRMRVAVALFGMSQVGTDS